MIFFVGECVCVRVCGGGNLRFKDAWVKFGRDDRSEKL